MRRSPRCAGRVHAGGDPELRGAGRRRQARERDRRGAARVLRSEDLNRTAPRSWRPPAAEVVIENYPPARWRSWRRRTTRTTRRWPPRCLLRVVYIERDDFMEEPPKKFFRLAPGREVRLRSAYFITCTSVVKDDAGKVVELRATYDPATRAETRRRPPAESYAALVSEARAIDCECGCTTGSSTSKTRRRTASCSTTSIRARSRSSRTQAGAVGGRCACRLPLSVRARGLLLRRSGLERRAAGVQPHRYSEGLVG